MQNSDKKISGSCCCGAVRFTVKGAPGMMGTCHCSRCRKLGATPFIFVKREQFELVSGEAEIACYQPEAPYTYMRSFCRRCGTALGEPLSEETSFPVNAHCFDDDPGVRNTFHEFVAEKPAWYEICDGARQFPGHPET
ncbi:GFA family protein [Roseibium sp.]|uniref:GFA family protein n=1 Tax=Roseibium sp. TaxID=1936156 RepID=UPI003BADAA5B